MNRRYTGLLLMFLFLGLHLRAQLTGTKNIPGDYPTLAAAISDLNAQGVGPGGVIINLLAGNPQTTPTGGYSITATGTATDPITFQGNNNTITAATLPSMGSVADGIFKIIGGDYISIIAFTLRENTLNTNTSFFSNNMTEWGIALLYSSATNGAQYNLVSGCNIALNRAYANTWGIYSNTRHTASLVAGDITAFSGSNSYNRIYSNTISNVSYGAAFIGSNVAAYHDAGNEIGGSSSGTGNIFTNWGGTGASSLYLSNTSIAYCVFMNHQVSDRVSYNTISSGLSGSSTILDGIFKHYSSASPVGTFTSTISNNTITLSQTASTGHIEHIRSQGIISLSTATLNITNNTIINSVLTGTSLTGMVLTGISNSSGVGALNITGNIIRTCFVNSPSGAFFGILNSGAVTNSINISNNQLGNSSGGAVNFNSGTDSFVMGIINNNASSAATININSNSLQGFSLVYTGGFAAITNSGNSATAININSNNLGTSSGNLVTFSGAESIDVRGINNSGGTSACALSIQTNNIRGIIHTVAATIGAHHHYISNSASTLTQNISNNLFTNLNVNTAGNIDFIYNLATLSSTGILTINNNAIVTAFSKPAAGGTVRFYNGTGNGSAAGSASNFQNNNFSNVTITGATTVNGFDDFDSGLSVKTISGNTCNNWTCGTATTTVMRFTLNGIGNIISANTITNITNTAGINSLECMAGASGISTITGNTISSVNCLSTAGWAYGIYCLGTSSTTGSLNINSNTIHSISSAASGMSAVGMNLSSIVPCNVFRNKLYNLQSSNANGIVNGILIMNGTANTVYNNYIGDLRTPSSANSNAIIGISVSGGTLSNLYFNTIYLNASSTGTNFGSSGISVSSMTTVDLRNNLVVNLSTPNGTGLTVAYRRTSTVLTSYSNSSNNNSFYAGTPGPSHLIFFDGFNSDQTLITYQARVAPRDNSSLTANPTFSSTTGSSLVFLHIPPATVTLLESGGTTIPGISIDYDNDVRPGPVGSVNGGATAPDIGADEFDGTPANCASSPVITVSPASTAYCYPGPGIILTASGSAMSYAWVPYISLSSQAGTSVTATPSVITTYTVTGYFANGCTSTANATVNINPSPTVTASASSSAICNGGSSTLSGSGASSYLWMPGSLSGTSVSVSPTVTTTYTVTGTDGNGCTNTANITITVNPLPMVTASASSSAICNGGSSTLSGSGASSYLWMPGSLSGTSVSVSPAATTTYTVTGTDGNGCTNTANITITVNPLPTVTASASSSAICNGGSSTLSGSGASTYLWMPGSLSGSSVSVSPAATTTYTVTGTDGNGCTNTASVTITVNPLPMVTASASSSAICNGGSSTLSGSGASTYLWMPGSISGSSVSVSPTATTTYTVTGTDGNSCTNTASVTITVNPLPTVTASASSSAICNGGSSTLSGSGASTYLWMPGSLSSSSVSVSPTVTTTYTVTGTDGNGCTNTANITITVNPLPMVTASASSSAICNGGSSTLSGSGASSYLWMPGSLSGSSVSVSPTATTTYTVTGTDGNGCTNTASETITVNNNPLVNLGPDQMLCGGQTILDALNPGSNYLWQDSITSTQTFVVSTGGNYWVTVTNAFGCSATDSANISFSANPVVALGNDTSICGGTMLLDAGNPGAVYLWNDNSSSQTMLVSSSGTYFVSATLNGTCTSTDTINITIHSLPVITFSLIMDTVCTNHGLLALNATPAGGIFSGPGVTGNTFDPQALIGTQIITYTYTDINGCMSSLIDSIWVDICNGITEKNNAVHEAELFPNPNNGEFTVRVNYVPKSILTIQIFNELGQITESINTTSAATKIDLRAYGRGVYLIRLMDGENVFVNRIVIQ